MSDFWNRMDGFVQRVVHQAHEGRTYVETTQPEEQAIYEDNARLRRDFQIRPASWYEPVAKIPKILLWQWEKQHPELLSKDPKIRSKKLLQLINENPQVKVSDRRA